MKVGIIGCGSIGKKRAQFLGETSLFACADIDIERAKSLAEQYHAPHYFDDWKKLLLLQELDIVIVATHHALLAEITLAAVQEGLHVLVEKPAACRSLEIEPILKAAEKAKVFVHVGFNHRYHPALRQAKILLHDNALGELLFIRARYGHGGRLGYEKEWRANPSLSGGGELIDQGIHLIDLSRWFLGDFTDISGFTPTYYWNMPVDDNSFLLLKTPQKKAAFLHASCTEWKNIFSFEIYGKVGKFEISGLGGSYGIERLVFHKMLPEMGPPQTTTWEYPEADDSWSVEWHEFIEDIIQKRKPSSSLEDAMAALKIVETVYRI